MRKQLVAGLAVVLIGGTLLARLWSGAASEDRARRVERLLTAVGAQSVDRPLALPRLDVPLEAHPATGVKGMHRYLGALLGDHPVILLNFWASWCPPCLEELRSLQELGRILAPYGVQIVAVSYDDSWAPQLRVFKELLGTEVPAYVLWLRDPQGQDGEVSRMMRTALGTDKLPETWVLTRGTVVAQFVGAQDWTRDAVVQYLVALAGSVR